MNGQTAHARQPPDLANGMSAGRTSLVAPLASTDATCVVPSTVAEGASEVGLSVKEITCFFEIAGDASDAIGPRDGAVALLHGVQRAEVVLCQVPPTRRRAALQLGAAAIRGVTA